MKQNNYFSPDVQFVDVTIEYGFAMTTSVNTWGNGNSVEGDAE